MPFDGPDPLAAGVPLDTNLPHIARVYDYWLGGKDNFAADRELAEKFMRADPSVTAGVRSNRAFLGRAVHYLVEEAGVRQFLDIGTGIRPPTTPTRWRPGTGVSPRPLPGWVGVARKV
jgi:hypothetical protein